MKNNLPAEVTEAIRKTTSGRFGFSVANHKQMVDYITEGAQIYHNTLIAIDPQTLMEERDKLQAFKDFVHKRLDEMSIPTHPDGEHSKAGCRIGDRLDIVARYVRLWK